jgi:aminocarboxymuconate-semialdehyde decarboxylase
MALHVNMHSHVVLTETLNQFPPYGPRISDEPDGTLAYQVGAYKIYFKAGDGHIRDPRFNDPGARLADMDAKGIDVMGVSISPLNYLYWAPAEIGREFSRMQNDAMARFCARDSNRLFFFATVPLQDVPASVGEFDRAVRELGARGLNIGEASAALGRYPDDEIFHPLYAKAEELDVPIFFHPFPPGIASGTGENQLDWMAGYLHQSTVAAASMLLGGIFDLFPRLKLILPHGGGALPYQFGRFEYAARRMRGSKVKRELREYLPNLYFDCLIHDPKARRFLVDFAGARQVLVGDNYLGWDAVDGFELVRSLGLSTADEERIMGGNATELFKLDGRVAAPARQVAPAGAR